ncbi:MAG: hypothetical protein LUG61_06110 [Lachnospiraceae bacterium]|nr:hypothetical protein [Lachnospiraceae bacterium]
MKWTIELSIIRKKVHIMFDILLKQSHISAWIAAFFLLSLLMQLALWLHDKSLLRGAENMSTVSHKTLKAIHSKFVQCYHMNGEVADIPVFVDNCLAKEKICGFSRRTFGKWSIQFLFYSVIGAGIGAFQVLALSEPFTAALPYYGICALELYLFFSVRSLFDAQGQYELLRLKLVEYFENHLVPRLKLNEAMSQVEDMPQPKRREEKKKRSRGAGLTAQEEDELEVLLREMV